MSEMLKFYKTRNVNSPTRGSSLSAGIDLYMPYDIPYNEMANLQPIASKGDINVRYDKETGIIDRIEVQPGRRFIVPSGIKVKFPKGKCGLLLNKSGVSTKLGLTLLACLIDEDYQGEILISFANVGQNVAIFEPAMGKAIAQMIIIDTNKTDLCQVDTIEELYDGVVTDRGEGGFGSTDRLNATQSDLFSTARNFNETGERFEDGVLNSTQPTAFTDGNFSKNDIASAASSIIGGMPGPDIEMEQEPVRKEIPIAPVRIAEPVRKPDVSGPVSFDKGGEHLSESDLAELENLVASYNPNEDIPVEAVADIKKNKGGRPPKVGKKK